MTIKIDGIVRKSPQVHENQRIKKIGHIHNLIGSNNRKVKINDSDKSCRFMVNFSSIQERHNTLNKISDRMNQ